MSVIVIGAGVNGLTTAFYLAKAGLKPLVLERRAVVGGGAITEEIVAGLPLSDARARHRPSAAIGRSRHAACGQGRGVHRTRPATRVALA